MPTFQSIPLHPTVHQKLQEISVPIATPRALLTRAPQTLVDEWTQQHPQRPHQPYQSKRGEDEHEDEDEHGDGSGGGGGGRTGRNENHNDNHNDNQNHKRLRCHHESDRPGHHTNSSASSSGTATVLATAALSEQLQVLRGQVALAMIQQTSTGTRLQQMTAPATTTTTTTATTTTTTVTDITAPGNTEDSSRSSGGGGGDRRRSCSIHHHSKPAFIPGATVSAWQLIQQRQTAHISQPPPPFHRSTSSGGGTRSSCHTNTTSTTSTSTSTAMSPLSTGCRALDDYLAIPPADDHHVLLSLTGPSGSGKTQLALQLAVHAAMVAAAEHDEEEEEEEDHGNYHGGGGGRGGSAPAAGRRRGRKRMVTRSVRYLASTAGHTSLHHLADRVQALTTVYHTNCSSSSSSSSTTATDRRRRQGPSHLYFQPLKSATELSRVLAELELQELLLLRGPRHQHQQQHQRNPSQEEPSSQEEEEEAPPLPCCRMIVVDALSQLTTDDQATTQDEHYRILECLVQQLKRLARLYQWRVVVVMGGQGQGGTLSAHSDLSLTCSATTDGGMYVRLTKHPTQILLPSMVDSSALAQQDAGGGGGGGGGGSKTNPAHRGLHLMYSPHLGLLSTKKQTASTTTVAAGEAEAFV